MAIGCLVKSVAGAALIGVTVFDIGSIAVTTLHVHHGAVLAAQAAESALSAGAGPTVALADARGVAARQGESVVAGSFSVAAGNTVTLSVRQSAYTLLLGSIPALRHLAVAEATGSAGSTL